jgi:hypothetical protein
MRNACAVLVEKSEGKRQLVKPRCRYIRMDLKEVGWEVVDWMRMAQDRDR